MKIIFQFIKDNIISFCLGFCVLGAAFTLMIVSQEVYERQKKVNRLSNNVLQAQWDIKSLNAELSYLSRPERVEQIATAIEQANPKDILQLDHKVISPVSLNLTAPIIPIQKPFIKAAAKKQNKTRQVKKPKIQYAENPKAEVKDFDALLNNIGGME